MQPCRSCREIRRRGLLAISLFWPILAWARGGPRGYDKARTEWFERQKNVMGGSCCELGDGHELDPGDVRFDQRTGLWSVRLPDPSINTHGADLTSDGLPKQWVEIAALKMRDPDGGMPPVSNPIVWYDVSRDGQSSPIYKIWCFEPNPQF